MRRAPSGATLVALAGLSAVFLVSLYNQKCTKTGSLRSGLSPSNLGRAKFSTMRGPSTKVNSEFMSPPVQRPIRDDDLVAKIADIEKEKMIQSLREKLSCAQDNLEKLKSKLTTMQDLPSKGKKASSSQRQRFARQRLHSSMNLELGLKEHWYPVEFASKVAPGSKYSFKMFGETYSLFRASEETATCRSSSGKELNVEIVDGLLWIYPGRKAPPSVPDYTAPPKGYEVHAELEMEVPVEHGLLMENLLDLAHAPFTHTSTFAKGWSVPESVKFHASNMLSGSWDPYPIDMAFDPPCMVNSKIGLVQVGKAAINLKADECSNHLHQLHVCLPTAEGKTRLLYRMSLDMDSLHWTKNIPGVNLLWKNIAEQVLSEDTSLVLGQQDRLIRGANTWENPVSYDKLGVRYRRWRNSLDSGDEKEKEEALKAVKKRLTAGELFHIEDEIPTQSS
mmetsp:Transcript_5069/g.12261  ORF Transcript_5069/g.12261 Transcript_5069/m.12261 type:complete len:449 (+) Transcript_5069:32-1378(+)